LGAYAYAVFPPQDCRSCLGVTIEKLSYAGYWLRPTQTLAYYVEDCIFHFAFIHLTTCTRS